MKSSEIKAMKDEGLKSKDLSLREEIFNLKMQNKAGTAENPLKIRTLKRDLARVKTEMSARANAPAAEGKGE